MRKLGTLVLILLICSIWVAILNIGIVKAEGSIVIKSDGSIEGTDRIERNGDLYYFTDNIEVFTTTAGILVQKDNIIIDGNGFNIKTTGNSVARGVDSSERFNVTIQNLNIIGFSQGIYNFNLYTDGISNNTIIGNTITGPSDQSFQVGIWIQGSLGDKIVNNKVTGYNEFGFLLYLTNSSYISGNVVTGNRVGFSLEYSRDNVFRNNQIYENEENIRIAFRHLTEFIHDIDSSNTVDNKPIYYWINQRNKLVPSQAGFVGLGNCSGIVIQKLEISNNGDGILLYSTTDSVIKDNNLENNGNAIEIRSSQNITVSGNKVIGCLYSGIRLALSSNIRIAENDIVNNQFGITLSGYNKQHYGYGGSNNVSILYNNFTGNNPSIDLSRSNENIISGNNFTNNNFADIRAVSCHENLIVANSFAENNSPAIYLSGATNNTFYHNNFINNKVEGLLVSNPWLLDSSGAHEHNTWDNGYEGNYWSDHNSRYPNTTEIDDSGIWDTPFFINEVNIDRFPLTNSIDIKLMAIPEFPSWVILPLLIVLTLVLTIAKNNLIKKR